MAQFYTDFREYAADQQPSDWTRRWTVSTWLVKTKTGTVGGKCLEDTGASLKRALSWDDAGEPSDAQVATKCRSSDTTGYQIGAVVRGSGAVGSECGYVGLLFHVSSLYLLKCANGGASSLGSVSFPWSANAWYWIRLQAFGQALKLKAWADGSQEPANWLIETSDSGLASGWAGVFTWAGNTHDFDVVGIGTNGDPAPTLPVGEPVTILADTRQRIYSPATVLADTRQRVYSTVQVLADTRQRVYSVAQLLADTRQRIYSPATVLADTRQRVYSTVQVLADTRQRVYSVAQLLADTRQRIYKPVLILADTLQRILRPGSALTRIAVTTSVRRTVGLVGSVARSVAVTARANRRENVP